MLTDNLNDSIITKIIRRLEKVEANGFLNASSISYGRMRFIGGKLMGEAGALFEWIGSVVTKGPWTNEGKFTNTGELEQNGNSTLNGDVKITKTLDVTAGTRLRSATTVEADLTVTNAGKVKVGSAMTLDPTVASGAVVFSNGAQVFTNGDTIQVYKGNGVVQISDTEARLQLGGSTVRVTADGVNVIGGLKVSALPPASGTTFPVVADAAGNLYRA